MKKIVLIEDDADLYSLIQYNLEKEGFQVGGSQTGKGALELCRRERPDLVILDIMLPDSDGLEILMSRPGVVFSREQLLDAVWGHDRAVTDRTVDVYVLRLRQKIEAEGGPAFIRSVRGFGYSFNQEPAREAAVQSVK